MTPCIITKVKTEKLNVTENMCDISWTHTFLQLRKFGFCMTSRTVQGNKTMKKN